jgi:uncharacterized membrane-anchored protein
VRARLFAGVILVHALVLVGWATSLEWGLSRAPRIRLAVAQRDPRDLLRGVYVDLRFEIQEIPADMIAGALPDHGDTIWVTLAPKGRVHAAVAASRTRTTPGPDQRVIAGHVQSFGTGASRRLSVEYGIERFYVPEYAGTVPRGQLEAEIALTDSGRPFLTRLFVDGRPYP